MHPDTFAVLLVTLRPKTHCPIIFSLACVSFGLEVSYILAQLDEGAVKELMTNLKRIQAKARELARSKLYMMGTPIFERRGTFVSSKAGIMKIRRQGSALLMWLQHSSR